MARLNLTIDRDFARLLAIFKKRYPLLKEVDIIKMAVAGYYTDHAGEFQEYAQQVEQMVNEAPKRSTRSAAPTKVVQRSEKKLVGLDDLFAAV